MHYYNEIDPYAAEWLRNLIAAGHIPDGHVDTRDIRDVLPSDLAGYTGCHFFAGLGGWAYALRLAGWPDDRPVWTGSCPCQPFSAAGKGRGFADERHLWPAWYWLIVQCRPDVVFGEQVDKATAWLDLVATDLEAEGYACGAVVLPAAGGGAPHGRHRLWFVADADARSYDALVRQEQGNSVADLGRGETGGLVGSLAGRVQRECEQAESGDVGNTNESASDEGCQVEQRRVARGDAEPRAGSGSTGKSRVVGVLHDARLEGWRLSAERVRELVAGTASLGGDFWSDADWIYCRDGKYRPVEPGTFPLAHGVSGRVGRLRAYGNAIVPQVAAEVIRAYCDTRGLSLL